MSPRSADRRGPVRRAAARLVGALIVFLARLITAVHADWAGAAPVSRTRIYFANHASNADFVLVWAVLPPGLRRRTRPVAGMDYWERTAIRRFVIHEVFHAVGVVRGPGGDPVEAGRAMGVALAAGQSLILFPEGTRNTTEAPLLPFRPGLWHLAQDHPQVELVPVWIENLNRVMPKGEIVPVPLICTVTFGAPLARVEGEGKEAFLSRARAALLATRPGGDAP